MAENFYCFESNTPPYNQPCNGLKKTNRKRKKKNNNTIRVQPSSMTTSSTNNKMAMQELTDTLSRAEIRDRIFPDPLQILSRVEILSGDTILFITLKGFPQDITHCLIQRSGLNFESTYPHDVLSKTYLLEVEGDGGGEFYLKIEALEDFNAHDWTVKACVRNTSISLSTNVVYECVRDLTSDFISGFKTQRRNRGMQPSRASTELYNLRLTLQPLSCRKVKLLWSCNLCLKRTASKKPRSNCVLRGESAGSGGANGMIIHIMEHWVNDKPGKEWLITLRLDEGGMDDGCLEYVLPVDLDPGHWYTIRTSSVYTSVMHSLQKFATIHSRSSNIVTYRAEHTVEELRCLLEKAQHIRNSSAARDEFLPCRWLYRHKPPEYFVDILTQHKGLMHPYIKDDNGDPASSINGKLNGLFFAANVDAKTLRPRELSIFGKVRLSLPSAVILKDSRLYFADVYCLRPSSHHVTLVLTTPGTPADQFCVQRLVELDWTSNPYLFKRKGMPYVTTRLHVEVLVTDSLDIKFYIKSRLGVLEVIQSGSVNDHKRRHGGKPKRAECKLCNL